MNEKPPPWWSGADFDCDRPAVKQTVVSELVEPMWADISVRWDEYELLRGSRRCETCAHLDALHEMNSDRGYVACNVCECCRDI